MTTDLEPKLFCMKCPLFESIPLLTHSIGYCADGRSDHNNHVLLGTHAACGFYYINKEDQAENCEPD